VGAALRRGKSPITEQMEQHEFAIRQAVVGKPLRARNLPSSAADLVKAPRSPVKSAARNHAASTEKGRAHSKQPPRPENHGKAWTERLEKRLTEQFQSGLGAKVLAAQAGRTEFSIRARLLKLGCITETQAVPE